MQTALKSIIPARIRRKVREIIPFGREEELTVVQGWDKYARDYKRREDGQHLGDEWSEPERLGVDVPPERLVAYLDETVFAPFLGQPRVLLEIGPGGGRFTEILLLKCERLLAADTSPAMLKLLRERFGGNSKIEYMLLDGRGLSSLADASVDAAFAYGVFVHLQYWDIYNYLLELKRVLKPGGRAIIQHANTFSELGWKRFLFEVPQALNKHKPSWAFSPMTPEVMKELVERAGLRLVACRTDVVRRDGISLIESPETTHQHEPKA